jgi:ADP-heptose:LPS heptosyltransferase
MGIGDEIMAAGEARRAYIAHGKRVEILDRHGRRRWHVAWDGLDYIARPEEAGSFASMWNGPGMRPYIAGKAEMRWTWDAAYRPAKAALELSADEKEFADRYRGRIIVEPHLKRGASPNKEWGWVRWNKLAWLLQDKGYRITQLGVRGTALLDGADFIETPTWRHAAAVLSVARAAVLPEGGLHHAAAAVGCRAVVIFGGYVGKETTGYDMHVNIGASASEACGMRVPCDHCKEWMGSITPGHVMRELLGIIE